MTQQLYIKTDGPIPEGCDYITAGKVYALADPITYDGVLQGGYFTDDHGLILSVCLRKSSHLNGADWALCDQHGNPAPAPWEGEKESQEDHACKCSLKGYAPTCGDQMRDDGTDFCENRLSDHSLCGHRRACHNSSDQAEPEPINWQAHAEALAECRDIAQNLDAVCSEYEALLTERDRLVEALERIASWPDGGNQYGQHHIKMFAAKALAALDHARKIEEEKE